MKKTICIIALIIAILSCDKNEKEQPVVTQSGNYIGTMTVVYQDEDYQSDSVKVSFSVSEKGDSASITLYKVRFVPQMPVTLDITIPGIAVTVTEDETLLSCEQSVPLAMGGEFPRYTVTGLKGGIKNDEIMFSLNFGNYPTSYRGKNFKEAF